MENENITDTGQTAETSAPAEQPEQKDPNAELRAYNDRLKEENKKLRSAAMRAELREIGLTPDAGLGVAIVESYKGDITAEAIGAFAAEKYKYEPAQAPTPPSVEAGERLETLQAIGEPVTPPQPLDAVQEAEGKLVDPEATRQDAITSATLKAQRLQQQILQGQI